MKKLLFFIFMASCLLPQLSSAEMKVMADAGIQNETDFSDHDNDYMWFRGNLGVEQKTDNFKGVVQLRFYPPDYKGIELEYLDYDTGEGTKNITKLEVYKAYGKYSTSILDFSIGVLREKHLPGSYFGDYAQRGAGGGFKYSGSNYYGLKLEKKTGMFHTALVFSTDQLEYMGKTLWITETIKPMDVLTLDLSCKTNALDKISNADNLLEGDVGISACYSYMKNQMVYTEIGLRDLESDEMDMPITLGATIPVGSILDKLVLELEYEQKEEGDETNALLFALLCQKKIIDHLKMDMGIYSDKSGTDISEVKWATRFTVGL